MKTCQACGCEKFGMTCEVCGTNAISREALDKLTNRYTACRTFAELCAMIQKPGEARQSYAPTIYPNNTHGGRKVVGRVMLIEAVRARGFKVYDGKLA